MNGSLQIKKGRYYAVIRVSDNKQKWIPTGLSVDGNKRKAQQRLREILLEYEEQDLTGVDISFSEWIKLWMEQKRHELRANTMECYSFYVNKHILPYFEAKGYTLHEINASRLQGYFNAKLKEGQSACTLKKHNAILHGCLEEAYKKDLITDNPANKVTLPKKKTFHGTAYNKEEAIQLLNTIEEDDPIRPAVVLAMLYGLRRSEALGLRWKDVDFANGSIFICNTVTRFSTVHETEETKTESSRRRLAFVPGTEKFFKELYEKQKESHALCGTVFDGESHVCSWADGRILAPDYVSKHFRLLLENNHLRLIRFHDLRHTAGSFLLLQGVDIKTIQHFLGHSQASTTMNIYLHQLNGGNAVAANAIGALMGC